MFTVLIRTMIIYVTLELSMKLMGKRQIGEFQLSELITTLLISELASLPIAEPEIPLLYAILPLLLIISLEVITSFISIKCGTVRRFLSGRPSIIINRGTLDQKELSRLRISCSELLGQLRQKGYSDISDVYYAIVEDDGMLSVFPRAEKRPPNGDELAPCSDGTLPTESGIAHYLIIDGKVINENLSVSGKDMRFIEARLRHAKCRVRDVFLLSCDDAGKWNLIKKDKKK